MASKSEAMDLYRSNESSERWHLVRKLLLLSLLVVASALGLVILSRQKISVPLVLFNLLADATIGFLIGLGSRVVLRRRHWFIQAITSAALSIVGLAVLGYFTQARSGIGPLGLQMVRVHWLDRYRIPLRLPLSPGRSGMDLLDLAHIVIAVDTSWMALRAWRRRPRVSGGYVESRPRPRASLPAAPARMSAPVAVAAPAVVAPPIHRSRPITRSRPLIKRRRPGRAVISAGATAVRPARRSSARRGIFRRRPAVQLAMYEEHKCPYCFEEVKRNDPRGSVECPICHTLHHKDCWDVTGTCQVPHLNT